MLKSLYHRILPDPLRSRLGITRRRVLDLVVRKAAGDPVPPAPILVRHQGSPWAGEHLRAGKAAADAVHAALELAGLSPERGARLLEIRCGPAGLLRHLRDTQWTLHGCDPDEEAIEWATRAFPRLRLALSSEGPPIPYSSGWFDVVIVTDLLAANGNRRVEACVAELARVLRGDGLLVAGVNASNGSSAAGAIPDRYDAQSVARLFSGSFQLLRWQTRGLPNGADLVVLRRL